ncbi:hypothetical protein [Roseateles toxinivorans]|uniref:Uncharacterized protein n=1 Tax=Roseateles toxinivorans TaxID=270368 RepID=A0A4R6QUT3_9BURK|nr:hypothetical protein [Roseateles toxinivorans]TDP74505.1 hypothetical protein DES47_101566 [Roseateles toxinivorans]
MNERELMRFCACCPNPCRRDVPASLARQVESETPSALALIALAVIDGHLPYDADAQAALSRTEAAHACKAACPYGYDIAGAVDTLNARLSAGAAA